VVEGQCEEQFAKALLVQHLGYFNVWLVPFIARTARDAATGRVIGRGGGQWEKWRRDISKLMESQPGGDVRFSTLFDVYGLPDDFPDRDDAMRQRTPIARVERLERAMQEALNDRRLIPYLQLHEFETYVFADLGALRDLLDAPDRPRLDRLAGEVAGTAPEEIDDGPDTAPSKRLMAHLGTVYQKTLYGSLVTEAIGLAGIRTRCPRFDAWVARLERLDAPRQP